MKRVLLVSTISLLWIASFAQTDKTTQRIAQCNVSSKLLGIKGYDPVAYFVSGKAVEGKSSFAASYQGINYYFANASNRDAFKANPTKYEPQYGGWCAYAMGNDGSKVEIDPETFKIENGKLYLFYNKYFTNTKKSWDKDEAHLMKNADANWAKIFK